MEKEESIMRTLILIALLTDITKFYEIACLKYDFPHEEARRFWHQVHRAATEVL